MCAQNFQDMIGGLFSQGLTAGLVLETAFIQVTLALPATSPSAKEQPYNEYLTEKPATWKKHHKTKIHNVLFTRRIFFMMGRSF